jgi:hypothetical protein
MPQSTDRIKPNQITYTTPLDQPQPVTESSSGVPKSEPYDARKSGATKEAAASKIAEHQITGQAQAARVIQSSVFVNGVPVPETENWQEKDPKGIFENQTGTVKINKKSTHRDDDRCEDPKTRTRNENY